MEKDSVEMKLNKVRKILERWEALSADDLIFTANCLKAAGVKNYKELRLWEKNNPDKEFYRVGNTARIVNKA